MRCGTVIDKKNLQYFEIMIQMPMQTINEAYSENVVLNLPRTSVTLPTFKKQH
jgi:polysaccharide deacetylase 2 family uncharacterized protein YibQ